MVIVQARDSDMDDAGEGLFAKKSLKQVDFAVALCDPSLKFPQHEGWACCPDERGSKPSLVAPGVVGLQVKIVT